MIVSIVLLKKNKKTKPNNIPVSIISKCRNAEKPKSYKRKKIIVRLELQGMLIKQWQQLILAYLKLA